MMFLMFNMIRNIQKLRAHKRDRTACCGSTIGLGFEQSLTIQVHFIYIISSGLLRQCRQCRLLAL